MNSKLKIKDSPELDCAIEAVLSAGEFLKENYLMRKRVKEKDFSSDLVSEIDTEAENLIIESIRNCFPEHGFFGEESGKVTRGDYRWVIDPIDGTTHYLKQIPLFTINIALQKNGETIVGVVYNPMTDDLFYAVKGEGAYWNDKRISVSDVSDISEALIYVEFPEKKYKEQKDFEKFYQARIEELLKLLSAARGVEHHRVGAWGICHVAKGAFDAYVDLSGSTKVFDVAPALLILEEAGGTVIDLEERKEDSLRIMATNGKLRIKI